MNKREFCAQRSLICNGATAMQMQMVDFHL